jgi:class 3 adenylate cyclase
VSADPSLPSGLVTFVFTDIEGSTKLFRRLGEAYPPLLEEHNALLREVWSAHGGAEVKTAGDSFLVAFASAADALNAAAAAQEGVTSHEWPTGATVRVRIGVHTGIAFPRNGDYIALAVHQAARVVGAANGGYVLASEEGVAAGGGEASVATRSVGAFRLRDFDKPAQLFAVAAPGAPLDADIPVRAIPAAGHNLVAPATTFVGRQDAVAHLSSRLEANRLLTIVGPGGMGKTRLATEVGLEVAARWPDGVWLADLTSVTEGDAVVSVVADALGVSSEGRDESTAVFDHLESRLAMLILDNCEHILDAVARFATAVLAGCPGIAVLATTR